MNRIEAYKRAKHTAERIKSAVTKALGRDDARNDKASVTVRFDGIKNDDWTRMRFAIGMSYGYYGSSSAYSVTSDEMGRYLAKAIEAHKERLLDAVIVMAEADAEAARRAAEKEAREVLSEVT